MKTKGSDIDTAMGNDSLFLPRMAKVIRVDPMTAREKFFQVELPQPLGHRPGQFVMVSVLGVGEAPISISCGPRGDNVLEMVIRNTGSLTRVLHNLQPGQLVGIRGPFGSGFDMDDFYGRDLLFVCGGLGIVPLRSLIQPVVGQPERFGKITIISGCRTPADELFREELLSWADLGGKNEKIQIVRLVEDKDHLPWDGAVGLVTDPLSRLEIDPGNTVSALCGPPVMYKFVVAELVARNLPLSHIYVDLERRMKCGVGKCGHCQINHLYCCQEGPVFRFSEIANLREALQ